MCLPCAGGGDKAHHPLWPEEILLQMEVTRPCLACGLSLVFEDIGCHFPSSNDNIPGWRPSLFFAAYVSWFKLISAACAHYLGKGVRIAAGPRVVPRLG